MLLPNQKIGQQSVHVGSALTMKTKFMHAPRAYILTLTYSLIQPKAIEYCADSAIPTEMIGFWKLTWIWCFETVCTTGWKMS